MDSNKSKDVLIIGQGLAGSILALELDKRGFSFNIIDNYQKNSASRVAGGITHPMSFKRLIESWKAKEFITFARKSYLEFGEFSGHKFWSDYPLLRPYNSIEDQNNWLARIKQPEFKDLVKDSSESLESIPSEFGLGEVGFSGKLNVDALLDFVKSRFKECYQELRFDHSDLEKVGENILYKGGVYGRIVFCEGFQYINNPFFRYLPSNVTKGEVLEIECVGLKSEKYILSKGCFVAPLEGKKDCYVVGSTYRWNNTNEKPTEEGRNELEERLGKMGLPTYTVLEHKCGVRPTTHDRRPMIGHHPKYDQLSIFSGMGSKTVMLAPLLAHQFINELEGKGVIFEEANIKRLVKKHYNKFIENEGTEMPEL